MVFHRSSKHLEEGDVFSAFGDKLRPWDWWVPNNTVHGNLRVPPPIRPYFLGGGGIGGVPLDSLTTQLGFWLRKMAGGDVPGCGSIQMGEHPESKTFENSQSWSL